MLGHKKTFLQATVNINLHGSLNWRPLLSSGGQLGRVTSDNCDHDQPGDTSSCTQAEDMGTIWHLHFLTCYNMHTTHNVVMSKCNGRHKINTDHWSEQNLHKKLDIRHYTEQMISLESGVYCIIMFRCQIPCSIKPIVSRWHCTAVV